MAIDRPSNPEFAPLPEITPSATHDELIGVLERHTNPKARAAANILRDMNPDDVIKVLKEAANFVTRDDRHASHLIGGNFAGGRGRMILNMDAEGIEERYPFLKFVCLKLVKMDALVAKELNIHLEVQRRIDATKSRLHVPRILAHFERKESSEVGIVMERLQADTHNGSLQTFIERLRSATDRRILRLTSDVAADINSAFVQFHNLGFIHRDANEGNVYLANATYRDITFPSADGRRRPTIRLIDNADVILLDFEKTFGFRPENIRSFDTEIRKENDQVADMVNAVELGVSTGDPEEDVVAAYEDMLRERMEKDKKVSKIA